MHDLGTDTGRIPLSVLGLGLMGQALASAFLARGHPTTVWNRTRAKAEPLTAQGAKHAWTVRDAVTAGPLVVICVSGYDNVRDILEPVSRDLAGRTLVNLTSGTSQAARETAKWAAHQGASYLDGAIMAVPPAIGTANATVLYSGPTTAFDRHQQALSSLGCPVYVGADHGLPSLFDAAALSLVWSTLNGFLHGAALLGKAGIPATAFARLAKTGIETVADWLPGYAQQIDDGTYPATDSTVNTNLTGMKHLLHESHAADINTELPELFTTLAEWAAAKGHSNNSYAAIIEQLRHPAQGGHGARRIPARARRYGDWDGPFDPHGDRRIGHCTNCGDSVVAPDAEPQNTHAKVHMIFQGRRVTENDEQRQTLTNGQGVPVLTYLEGVREGHPWADLAEVVGPNPVDTIIASMSGWAVSGSVELGEQLLGRGARVMRHAHEMRRDLIACPPPVNWSSRDLGNGLRAVPCDLDADAVFPAWRAAFHASHPDHFSGSDEEALNERLAPMLAGSVLGPVLSCSTLVVDETDRVVAGAILTDRDGLPWIADVFRRPEARYAGLGANLLRRVLSDAAADGLADVSLVVSDANPARHVYEKLDFQLTGTSLTVVVP